MARRFEVLAVFNLSFKATYDFTMGGILGGRLSVYGVRPGEVAEELGFFFFFNRC